MVHAATFAILLSLAAPPAPEAQDCRILLRLRDARGSVATICVAEGDAGRVSRPNATDLWLYPRNTGASTWLVALSLGQGDPSADPTVPTTIKEASSGEWVPIRRSGQGGWTWPDKLN